jgi:hypothetical protein
MIASLIYCSRDQGSGEYGRGPFGSAQGRLSHDSRRDADGRSAVFAIEEVAHGAAACSVDFECGAAFGVVGRGPRSGLGRFLRLAARGAAIGEAGLAGAELELLVTDDAGFDREGHARIC